MINNQSNKLLDTSVIYLGGVSAVGKTTVTQQLSNNIKRAAISLDNYSNLINNITDGGKTTPVKSDIARQVIEDLVYADSTCIVEGVWVKPNEANIIRSKFPSKFTAIYCGYPSIDPNEYINTIRETESHWLAHEPKSWAIDFLAGEVKQSQLYKTQCELYGFTFVDFSDQKEGSKHLLSLFKQENKNPYFTNLSFSYNG